MIFEYKPDLIFLDVELERGESGFSIIEKLKNVFHQLPAIIMTTGHDKYAKRAINNDVLFFVSKPILSEELEEALIKFEHHFLERKKHLVIKTSKEGIQLVDYNHITFLKADRNYTYIYKENGTNIYSSKSLKFYEERLPKQFLRIHESHIINTKFIQTIQPSQLMVELKTNHSINEYSEPIIESDIRERITISTKTGQEIGVQYQCIKLKISKNRLQMVKNAFSL